MKKFRPVGTLDIRHCLDLWGGADGTLPSIWMSVGSRGEAGGGDSAIYRHDRGAPDLKWVEESIPSGSETIAKIVDDGETVYAYFETGGPDTSPVISRPVEGGDTWEFDGPTTTDFVGGRGLATHSGGLLVGGSHQWNHPEHADSSKGELFHGSDSRRVIAPGLCWEVIVQPPDIIWEFWHGGPHVAPTTASVYVDGEARAAPTENVACAAEFDGAVYAGGDHTTRTGNVWRWTGSEWEVVLEMPGMAEHLVSVPRDPPVFYAVCQAPLAVYESLDGTTWDRHEEIPEIATGEDTNNLCGLGYHDDRVWLAARDDTLDRLRLWVDAGGADILLQVI